jgi:hypothetical protein
VKALLESCLSHIHDIAESDLVLVLSFALSKLAQAQAQTQAQAHAAHSDDAADGEADGNGDGAGDVDGDGKFASISAPPQDLPTGSAAAPFKSLL